MNGLEDLFGNIDLTEELNVPEGINQDEGSKGEVTPKSEDNQQQMTKLIDQPIIDLQESEELIDVEESTKIIEEDNQQEEKKLPPDQKVKKDSNSSSSPENSPFIDLSKLLFEKGVLTQFDESEFSSLIEENNGDAIEAFSEYVKKTVEDVHEDWINSYPEPIQDLIRASQAGIPLDKMLDVKKNQVQLDGITEDKLEGDNAVDLRKQILTEHYKATTKFSDDKIKKLVDNSINLGEDEQDAKEALKELKDFRKEEEKRLKDEAIKQQELLKKQQSERMEQIKKDVYGTKEIIPSIPVTKKEQEELYKSMTTIVHTDGNGRGMTDVDYQFAKYPLETRKALHYYFQKGLFKVDEKTGTWNPDFSKITNTLKTQVTKEVKNEANNSRGFKAGSPSLGSGDKPNLAKSFENFLKSRE